MQFLAYLLSSITAFLGLVAGMALIKLAPEEQKPGKKYFLLVEYAMYSILVGLVLFFYGIHIIICIGVGIVLFALLTIKKFEMSRAYILYAVFGIVLFLLTEDQNLFLLACLCVFIFGMAMASKELNVKKNNYFILLRNNAVFFIPIILLWFAI